MTFIAPHYGRFYNGKTRSRKEKRVAEFVQRSFSEKINFGLHTFRLTLKVRFIAFSLIATGDFEQLFRVYFEHSPNNYGVLNLSRVYQVRLAAARFRTFFSYFRFFCDWAPAGHQLRADDGLPTSGLNFHSQNGSELISTQYFDHR